MKWFFILCVLVGGYLLYNHFNETMPRSGGVWPQAVYDRELAFCQASNTEAVCSCAVDKTENQLQYDDVMTLEENAGKTAVEDPLFSNKVAANIPGCRRARSQAPVVDSAQNVPLDKPGKNAKRYHMRFNPKTGTWEN